MQQPRVPVIAVIGAGASLASGDYAFDEAPPLTRDLFQGHYADQLLPAYPLAQMAGRLIKRAMTADTTLAFEQALLSLRTDEVGHHGMMSWAVPLYLQALLLGYSQRLAARAERYDALIDELLKLNQTHVHFVSLNYDTLLDRRLDAFFSLDTMNDYIAPMKDDRAWKNWSLIKPHGSVNWFVATPEFFDPLKPQGPIENLDSQIQCLPVQSNDLQTLRGVQPGPPHLGADQYPALALPEGPKDTLVLPEEHLRFFQDSLSEAYQVDVLVLGYSAIDTEILDLIKASDTPIRRMTIANRDAESALVVFDAISAHGIRALWPDVVDGSFASWVDGNGLRDWVREFGGVEGPEGPYPTRMEPSYLQQQVNFRKYEAMRGRTAPNFLDEPM